MESDMIKIGMLIADRYEVLEKVGTGGMSDVYKAKDHRLNRMVAVKVLKQEFSENASFVSKFRVEAQAAAGLMHPNIVNVYDVGEEKGNHFIIMELVNGITLKRYIEKKERLTPREAVTVAIQVAMGLAAAHRNHIIHRDIKPQNIIISKEGKVKVTDFGIAKASTSNTITSNVMGSVHYTSPEQARGGFSDEKSDVYSLGVTLYEMLTGNVPYEGDTTVAIALQHIQDPFPSPREKVPDLPYSVEQIVLKCCEKSPDRRYQTMDELASDLRRSLNDPDGDFVRRIGEENLAETRAMTSREREEIRKRSSQTAGAAAAGTAGAAAMTADGKTETEAGQGQKRPAGAGADVRPADKETGAVSGPENTDRENASGRPSSQDPLFHPKDKNDEDQELEIEEKRLDRLVQILSVLAVITVIVVFILVLHNRAASSAKKDEEAAAAQTPVEESQPEEAVQEEAPEQQQQQVSNTVAMPRVVGLTAREAQEAIERAGLRWEIIYDISDLYDEGIVMAANAAEGQMVQRGATVTITVVRVDRVMVPEVVDHSREEAENILQELGLFPAVQEVYSDEVNAGYVEGQDPEADTEVPAGSEITLYVSIGPDLSGLIQVPNILGLSEQEAATALLQAGLVPGEAVVTDTSGRYAPDTVIGQSIPRGDYVEEGTQVDMEISGTASYSYSARIEAPRRSEDPDYQEGTAVTLVIVTDDGETILNKTTTEFPYPVSFTGISCEKGTLYMNYTNIVREDPQTGISSDEDEAAEYGIPMEITRELTFTNE